MRFVTNLAEAVSNRSQATFEFADSPTEQEFWYSLWLAETALKLDRRVVRWFLKSRDCC